MYVNEYLHIGLEKGQEMASSNTDYIHTDEFDNLMDAYDAGMALLHLLRDSYGMNERDSKLIDRVFNDMIDAKDEFTEMIENAKTESKALNVI